MNRLVAFFHAALRGPAGGMLACVLLAAMLGGIAMANPDAMTGADPSEGPRGGASHGGGSAVHGREPDGGGGGGTAASGEVHSVGDCRALIRHLRDDADAGNHAGLSQAIEVVSEKCRSHLQAGGLLRALERLVENRERWEERHGDGAGKAGDPPSGGDGGNGKSGNGSSGNGGGNGQARGDGTTTTSTTTSTSVSGGSTDANGTGNGAPPNR